MVTSIPYKLHHVGILCGDPAGSTAFYRDVLGHEVTARYFNKGSYDLTFLGSGSDLLLELVGPPFSDGEQAHFEAQGGSFHHLAFSVPDVDAAFAELTANGVAVAWEPDDFLFVRHCGVVDDSGVVVEVLQELAPLARAESTLADRPVSPKFLLHHFDILTTDWRRSKAFYATHFGLHSVFEHINDDGGAFVYMADAHFDVNKRQVLLELIGPPYEERRELEFAAHFGTGMDHIGYVVADVKEAYELALRNGAKTSRGPYTNYGTQIGWLQDSDGNELELMLSLNGLKMAN